MNYRKRKWTDEQFIEAVKSSFSKAEVLRKLGLKATGANYTTVNVYVKEFNLNTSHWTGRGHLKGKRHSWSRVIPLEMVLVENSDYISTNFLKKRLIKEGMLTPVCKICGLESIWNGRPIVLQIDHINGTRSDNRIENLRLLCPNCHSQTHTFAGKNK